MEREAKVIRLSLARLGKKDVRQTQPVTGPLAHPLGQGQGVPARPPPGGDPVLAALRPTKILGSIHLSRLCVWVLTFHTGPFPQSRLPMASLHCWLPHSSSRVKQVPCLLFQILVPSHQIHFFWVGKQPEKFYIKVQKLILKNELNNTMTGYTKMLNKQLIDEKQLAY